MLSEDDKKEMQEHLSRHYLLIPKNRVPYIANIVGGFIGFIVLGLGISYHAVMDVLDSEMADKAKQNIKTIEADVEKAHQSIIKMEQDGNEIIENMAASEIVTVKSLQAKEVKIIDNNGKTKLLLSAATTGSGLLQLYDDTDKNRVEFYGIKSGYAGIRLIGRDGDSRMILTTDSAGLPSLYLKDSTKKMRLKINEDNGYVGINLMDRDENSRMTLTTDSEGLPSLYLNDSAKKMRLQLYESKNGYAGLALLDRNNNFRMKLMTEPNAGWPTMEMYNNNQIIFSSQHLQSLLTTSPSSLPPAHPLRRVD